MFVTKSFHLSDILELSPRRSVNGLTHVGMTDWESDDPPRMYRFRYFQHDGLTYEILETAEFHNDDAVYRAFGEEGIESHERNSMVNCTQVEKKERVIVDWVPVEVTQ